MDLNIIAPIIENIVKDTLKQRVYPFGVKRQGLGNKNASGNLINSVKVVNTSEGNIQSLQLDFTNAESYADIVESGRKPGTYVPIKAIMQWIAEKGIGVRDERGRFVRGHRQFKNKVKQGNNDEVKNIAFAIRGSIFKFGIRPSNFMERSLQNIQDNNKLLNLLSDEEMKTLINIIQQSND